MTKADLAKILYDRFTFDYQQRKYVDVSKYGFSRDQCMGIVNVIFEELKEGLVQEGKVKLSGFGTFEVKQKTSRRGRNPQTGESVVISSRKVLSFKASPVLKAQMNNKEEDPC